MKTPMFAQSRLVFFAGGETPKTPDQRFAEAKTGLESLLKEEDIGMIRLKSLTDAAEKAIADMPKGKAKTNARDALNKLTENIQTKIDGADSEKEGALTKGLRKIKESAEDELVRIEEQAKIEAAQKRLTTKIDDIKEAHNDLLESADADLKSWVEDSIGVLTELQGNVNDTTPDPMATSDQDLAKWEKDLSTDIDVESETSPSFKIALKEFNRREEIRATDLKLQENFRGAEEYADGRDDKELLRGATEARAAYNKVLAPSAGSDMSKWEAYAQKNNDMVATFNQQKAEYIAQVQAKQAAETAIAEIQEKIDTQIKGKHIGMGIRMTATNNNEFILKAAKDVETKITALSAIEPKFGDTSVQAEIGKAKAVVDYAYNKYNGEVAAQNLAVNGGNKGERIATVYADFQDGKFKTFAEFEAALNNAKNKPTTGADRFKPEEEGTLDDTETTKAIDNLKTIAKSSLEMREKIDNFVASAKGAVTSAVDNVSKFFEQAAAEAAKPEPAAEPKAKPKRVVRKAKKPAKAVADIAGESEGQGNIA